MHDANEQEQLVENAQERAFLYSLLAVPFMILPDAAFVERIRSRDFLSIWEGVAANQALSADMRDGAALMLNFINAERDRDKPEIEQILGLDRTSLYRGVMPGVGAPPPYEAVWTDGDASAVLLRLAEVYRQSEMTLSEESPERLDYLGIELEYLACLIRREETMWTEDRGKALEWMRRQAYFFTSHIGRWAPRYIDTALPMATTDFYRGHLIMLRGFLKDEQEFFRQFNA